MENILFWIIVGVVAGWLAKMVVPGEGPGGLVGDFIVGIVGAVTGGFLFNSLMGHSYGGWVGSTGVAFVGAVVMLAVLRALHGRRIFTR